MWPFDRHHTHALQRIHRGDNDSSTLVRNDALLIGLSVIVAILATLGINRLQQSADDHRKAQIALAQIDMLSFRMHAVAQSAYAAQWASRDTMQVEHETASGMPDAMTILRLHNIEPSIDYDIVASYTKYRGTLDTGLSLLAQQKLAAANKFHNHQLTPAYDGFRSALHDADIRLNQDAETANSIASMGADCLLIGTLSLLVILLRRSEAARQKTLTLGAERKSLRQSEARFQSLLRNVHDIIVVLERDGTIRYISPAVETLTGDSQIDLMGASFYAVVHHDEVGRAQKMMNQAAAEPHVNITSELAIRTKSGVYKQVEVIMINQMNAPEVAGFIATVRDVTERKSFEQQLTHQAFHDTLTGLPNRKLFRDRLAVAIHRTGLLGVPSAVMFIDLDNFKVVNDSLGHQAGDALLLEVADRLGKCLRDGDTLARFGGDEFTVLIEDATEQTVLSVANRIIDTLDHPILLDDMSVFTTASVGIAYSNGADDDTERLLRDADTAMYEAKTGGKGRYCIFDESMSLKAADRLTLESELRMAVERDEIRVFYQPIVELKSGLVLGLEALMRWEHPTKGLMSPATFIPVAEETGLIVGLGRHVLNEACGQLKIWQEQFTGAPILSMSVNLSARQFQHPRLIEDVAAAIRANHIDPATLKLEITESVTIKDAEATSRKLGQLKDIGVQLAVDDFGTGYSSMSYLKMFPVDTIKIDRSFVSRIGKKSEDEAIINAIITLANTMHLDVTSEGIETAEQLSVLKAMGCEHGQGYFFAKPATAEEIEPFIAASRPTLLRSNLLHLPKAA